MRSVWGPSPRSSPHQIKTGTHGLSYLHLFVIVIAAAALALYAMQSSFARHVVYLENGGWHAAPGVMIGPQDFKISPTGEVWTVGSGVLQSDGKHYKTYRYPQLGTDFRKKPRGGLAFRNQEVWVAHEEGVLRFDGRGWQLFREALRTSRPESIAANAAGVWVVDSSGNLSHFDGASWTVTNLSRDLPEVQWGGIIGSSHPALALTADGALWIAWQGLWRFDSRNWREVRPGGNRALDVTLVGADAYRLWLLHGSGMLDAVGESGDITAHYTRADLDLGPKSRISAVAADGNEIYVGTTEGLFILSGGRCRRIAGPDDAPVIAKLAVAPGGGDWAIADQVPGLGSYIDLVWTGPNRWIVVLVAGIIGFLARWKQSSARLEFPALPAQSGAGAQGRGGLGIAPVGPVTLEWAIEPKMNLPLTCPSCGRGLSGCFKFSTDSIRCVHCQTAIHLQDLVPKRTGGSVSWLTPPAGITVSDDERDWTLTASARSPRAIVYWILGSAIAAGPMLMPSGIQGLTLLLVAVAVLSLLLKAAMGTWGRYSISVQDSDGTVFSGIGALGLTRRFRFPQLHRVRFEDRSWQIPVFTEHQIVLEAEDAIFFGNHLKDEQLCYIAIFLLKKRLGAGIAKYSVSQIG